MQEPITIVDRDVLKVLSVDTRMDIIKILAEGGRTPSFISKKLNKTDATIVEHLQTLVKAGLVKKVEQPGKKWIFYTLTDKGYGIISSKSRKLVIILGTSLFGIFVGAAGMLSNFYISSGVFSRMVASETGTQIIQEAASKTVTSLTLQEIVLQNILLYAPIAITLISLAGLAYYFYSRSKFTGVSYK